MLKFAFAVIVVFLITTYFADWFEEEMTSAIPPDIGTSALEMLRAVALFFRGPGRASSGSRRGAHLRPKDSAPPAEESGIPIRKMKVDGSDNVANVARGGDHALLAQNCRDVDNSRIGGTTHIRNSGVVIFNISKYVEQAAPDRFGRFAPREGCGDHDPVGRLRPKGAECLAAGEWYVSDTLFSRSEKRSRAQEPGEQR